MVRPCIQVRILLFQPDLTGSFLFAPLWLPTAGVTCYPCCLCAYAAQTTECSDFPLQNNPKVTHSNHPTPGPLYAKINP